MLTIISFPLFPNDSRIVLGSSVEMVDNEETNVVMEEERIIINLMKDHYEVDVTFAFKNTGPEETISLGFPVESIFLEYDAPGPELDSFTSTINGKAPETYTVKEEQRKDRSYINKTTWYIREVVFPANEYTYSRVSYKARYSNSGFFKHAGYIYGSGRNWKNSIGKMTIIITHDDSILIKYYSIGSGALELLSSTRKPDGLTWKGNGEYHFEFRETEPGVTDRIRINIEPFDLYGNYHNEFGDWAEGWIWNTYLLYEDDREIRLFTRNQLRLFINFFYAFHGYPFKNDLYRTYFSKIKDFVDYNSTKYTINPDFSEKDFNPIERKNIDYLLKLEKMIPE